MHTLSHPNIVRLHAAYLASATFVMEYHSGGDLFEHTQRQGRTTEPEVATMMKALFDALTYIHDLGIVHRNVRAEHLVLRPSGTVVLIDFGLAVSLTDTEALQSYPGTPGYAAREIIDRRPYGVEVDCFATGVVLFFILCGKLPFNGSSTQHTLQNTVRNRFHFPKEFTLSTDAKDLVLSLLQGEPRRRLSARAALAHPMLTRHAEVPRSSPSCYSERPLAL